MTKQHAPINNIGFRFDVPWYDLRPRNRNPELPQTRDLVLVTMVKIGYWMNEYTEVDTGWYSWERQGWYDMDGEKLKVIGWHPLPEPLDIT